MLSPGRFVFRTGPDDSHRLELEVTGVVEATYTRAGSEGPYRLGVWQLRTPDRLVYWLAHRTVLAEGAAILRGSADPVTA